MSHSGGNQGQLKDHGGFSAFSGQDASSSGYEVPHSSTRYPYVPPPAQSVVSVIEQPRVPCPFGKRYKLNGDPHWFNQVDYCFSGNGSFADRPLCNKCASQSMAVMKNLLLRTQIPQHQLSVIMTQCEARYGINWDLPVDEYEFSAALLDSKKSWNHGEPNALPSGNPLSGSRNPLSESRNPNLEVPIWEGIDLLCPVENKCPLGDDPRTTVSRFGRPTNSHEYGEVALCDACRKLGSDELTARWTQFGTSQGINGLRSQQDVARRAIEEFGTQLKSHMEWSGKMKDPARVEWEAPTQVREPTVVGWEAPTQIRNPQNLPPGQEGCAFGKPSVEEDVCYCLGDCDWQPTDNLCNKCKNLTWTKMNTIVMEMGQRARKFRYWAAKAQYECNKERWRKYEKDIWAWNKDWEYEGGYDH